MLLAQTLSELFIYEISSTKWYRSVYSENICRVYDNISVVQNQDIFVFL